MSEIEKDLVRWKRGKWTLVIGFVFILHLGILLLASQQRLAVRKIYPGEPVITAAAAIESGAWEDIDNPFLFASAGWNGFSAEGWLHKPAWAAPEVVSSIPIHFQKLTEAHRAWTFEQAHQPFSLVSQRLPGASFPVPPEPRAPERNSELRVEGLPERRLLSPLPLPLEFHTDVLSNSVVEALIGADGLVISARVVENSGSPKADSDALSLAFRARFTPKLGTNRIPDLGKLIFEWFALDLSQATRSNSVSPARR